MENEKISDARIDEPVSHDSKAMNEKTAPIVSEHEPYDAVALNMTMGEFPMHPTPRGAHDQSSLKEELIEEEVPDLYKPFPVDETIPLEENILTIRAVVVGIVLGCLVNASNLYLGMLPQLHFSESKPTIYRTQNRLHLQRDNVWCYLRIWNREVNVQVGSQFAYSWRILRSTGERHHPSLCHWCRWYCWPLCCRSACHVSVGSLKLRSEVRHWTNLYHYLGVFFLWSFLRHASAKVLRHPGFERA